MGNEEKLIIELKNGNENAFETIYRTYFNGLYSFAAQYVKADEGYEIVQNTMLWLWENKESLIPELSVKSLLFTIVKNKALNSIQRNNTYTKIQRQIIEKNQHSFDDPDLYLNNELSNLLSEALAKMPEKTRRIFEMNRFERMTHKEIADELEVSVQTVNYQISNALKLLRQELKDYLPLILALLAAGIDL